MNNAKDFLDQRYRELLAVLGDKVWKMGLLEKEIEDLKREIQNLYSLGPLTQELAKFEMKTEAVGDT